MPPAVSEIKIDKDLVFLMQKLWNGNQRSCDASVCTNGACTEKGLMRMRKFIYDCEIE